MMSSQALTDADFDRLREIVYAKTGMRFDSSRRPYVEKRVLERVERTNEGDATQYISHVRFDRSGTELQELINALTVNETYFFREDYQLKCLTSSMLPEIARIGGRKTLRIWSLPCSTGEEAYSLAIQMLESFPGVDDYDIEIVGSDIDTKVLAAAERGLYSNRSVQYVAPRLLSKYFVRVDSETWRICDGLIGSVTFNQISVVDRMQMLRNGRFDVIFCRNLLIYFDDISRRLAADNIFEALHPGGFICLGHSESMGRISANFKVRKFDDAIVYQRP
jgi:chemotaxis protein methyltransferase CheR